MQKQDWVKTIEMTLRSGHPFTVSYKDDNKAPLLFACDVFRRRKHDVQINFDPTLEGRLVLHVIISASAHVLEFTIRREQTAEEVIRELKNPHILCASVRGCGTVTNTVCDIIKWSIHNGWIVEKTFLNTLTQTLADNIKQRNTTLVAVLRRVSIIGSI